MKAEQAPNLSGVQRRKLREAQQEADKAAVYEALMAAIKNPASRPETVVRAAELLQKGFFGRGNHWPGGDP